jgi:hypothetical protein
MFHAISRSRLPRIVPLLGPLLPEIRIQGKAKKKHAVSEAEQHHLVQPFVWAAAKRH